MCNSIKGPLKERKLVKKFIGLKDEMIRILVVKGQGHCGLTKYV